VVHDLLPVGLTLLAGKPKHGKSWFALSAALAIASGGQVLDTYEVERGEVIYMALEDTEYRLQERVRQLLATHSTSLTLSDTPTGIEFALAWPRLEQGGLEQLEAYIEVHPRLRTIIVDTWAVVAPHPKGSVRPQYEGDYAALTPLKRLAEAHHLAIMLVHHLRKAGAQDVIDEITGSTGMAGAADAILILKRERGQEQGSLFVTGRDIPERFLPLRFDAASGLWRLDRTQEHDAEEQGETGTSLPMPLREREEHREQ
jgi:RecA-family ATPase